MYEFVKLATYAKRYVRSKRSASTLGVGDGHAERGRVVVERIERERERPEPDGDDGVDLVEVWVVDDDLVRVEADDEDAEREVALLVDDGRDLHGRRPGRQRNRLRERRVVRVVGARRRDGLDRRSPRGATRARGSR